MKRKMVVTDWIHVFAGTFILVSLGLGVWVNPYWYLLAAFVGLNLFQFGFTGICPLGSILKGLGVRTHAEQTANNRADKGEPKKSS